MLILQLRQDPQEVPRGHARSRLVEDVGLSHRYQGAQALPHRRGEVRPDQDVARSLLEADHPILEGGAGDEGIQPGLHIEDVSSHTKLEPVHDTAVGPDGGVQLDSDAAGALHPGSGVLVDVLDWPPTVPLHDSRGYSQYLERTFFRRGLSETEPTSDQNSRISSHGFSQIFCACFRRFCHIQDTDFPVVDRY